MAEITLLKSADQELGRHISFFEGVIAQGWIQQSDQQSATNVPCRYRSGKQYLAHRGFSQGMLPFQVIHEERINKYLEENHLPGRSFR